MDFGSIFAALIAHLPEIGIILGSLIAIDEVVLKIWPSPTQSSFAYRFKELLDLILKLLPSTKE